MEQLIGWFLSAIDYTCIKRNAGKGEPACPQGTFPAGYTRDAWDKTWLVNCAAPLEIEDVEDLYILFLLAFGLVMIGFFTVKNYRTTREVKRKVTSLMDFDKLTSITKTKDAGDPPAGQTVVRLEGLLEENNALLRDLKEGRAEGHRRMDHIMWVVDGQQRALASLGGTLKDHHEQLCREMVRIREDLRRVRDREDGQ